MTSYHGQGQSTDSHSQGAGLAGAESRPPRCNGCEYEVPDSQIRGFPWL